MDIAGSKRVAFATAIIVVNHGGVKLGPPVVRPLIR
jgi:hypothetical protein